MSIDPRITKAFKEQVGFDLESHCVVAARVGSDSHGTKIPKENPDSIDDTDYMIWVVPPVEYLLGLRKFDNWVWQSEELDVVVYSLHKAVTLLLKNNPNVVGMLWLNDDDYVHTTMRFRHMLNNRNIFSSKLAADSFIGYATGQLKKMEAFDIERMNDYEKLTKFLDFWMLDRQAVLNKHPDKMQELLDPNIYYQDPRKMDMTFMEPSEVADLLRQFRKLHTQFFSGYMGEKRKKMVRQFSYDVKNASHLIRLLRMGQEFLATGRLNVFRDKDAAELIAIKKGEWTLDEVKQEAERLFALVREAEASCTLPDAPNFEAANKVLVQLQYPAGPDL